MDTSPSNGAVSFDPFVKNPNTTPSLYYGDYHFYYLLDDCEDDYFFPYFRFLSESGFQSEPSFSDYESVSLPEDWGQNTTFLRERTTFNQPHSVMIDQSKRHYHIPADRVGDKDYFSYYLWITQIQQGRCMATISEK